MADDQNPPADSTTTDQPKKNGPGRPKTATADQVEALRLEVRQSADRQVATLESMSDNLAKFLQNMAAKDHPSGAVDPVQVHAELQVLPSGVVVERQDRFGELVTDTDEINEVIETMKDDEVKAFMREIVVIRITPTSRKDESEWCEFGLNGDLFMIRRGYRTRVSRAQLEVIGRCKPTVYSSEEKERAPNDLSNKFDYTHTTSQRYPLDLCEDTDRGRAWWNSILREAA